MPKAQLVEESDDGLTWTVLGHPAHASYRVYAKRHCRHEAHERWGRHPVDARSHVCAAQQAATQEQHAGECGNQHALYHIRDALCDSLVAGELEVHLHTSLRKVAKDVVG